MASLSSAIHIDASGLAALQRGFERAPEFTRERLLTAMTEATLYLEREVKDAFPAVSGLTRASITADAFSTPAGVLGVVGSASPAVAAVELGTKPHMPPVAAILLWVQDKFGLSGEEAESMAWGVARKIRARGTKGQGHFQKTLAGATGTLTSIFQGAVQDVAQHLADDARGGLA